MNVNRPRVGAELLSVKGRAEATPDVVAPVETDGLAALANERKPAVTFTFRMDAERHKRPA
jgi:hypothetical protein